MSTVDYECAAAPRGAVQGGAESETGPPLQRIGVVRAEQGVSIRTAARQLGLEPAEARRQERETADLRLSELYQWQGLLEVPVADLLVDPGTPLSRPVLERARLLRLMKTAAAILESTHSVSTRRMAQTMVNQLLEIMPELAEVGAWHSVGQRRSLEEFGRALEQQVPTSLFRDMRLDD